MKQHRKLILILAVVLSLAIAAGGTMAYLQDTDEDVNVMTLGSVYIVQNEQEWQDGKLIPFTNNKPLYPYVGEFGWNIDKNDPNLTEEDKAYRQMTMENVVDKYVTVTNTGKSPAYVRTVIALEMGDYTYEEFKMIGLNINSANGTEFKFPGTWEWVADFVAEIDGHNYNIMIAEHQNPLLPDETTIPSLNQIYLSKDAGNEEVEKLDGNGNGKYDVLVLSQAVQTMGFADANTALNEAFPYGENYANVPGWFKGEIGSPGLKNPDNNPPMSIPEDVVEIHNFEELTDALNNGGNYLIVESIEVTGNITSSADAAIYNKDHKNVLTFATNKQIIVGKDTNVTFYGVEIDGEGTYSLYGSNDEFSGENLRTKALFNVMAGATLTLDGGSHIENIVSNTEGQSVLYAAGETGNAATLILKDVTIENCVGRGGTVIATSKFADVYIEDGAVIKNNISHSNRNHGILKIYGSSGTENHSRLIMNGGVIKNNQYSGNGLIGLYRADMIMNGGSITENTWYEHLENANGRYGLIYVHSEACYTMNGGEITGNTLRWYSRGVIDANSGAMPHIVLNAGTIKDNYENYEGDGAVYDVTFSSWSETGEYFKVSDKMVTSGTFYDFSGNAEGNVIGLSTIVPNM